MAENDYDTIAIISNWYATLFCIWVFSICNASAHTDYDVEYEFKVFEWIKFIGTSDRSLFLNKW